MGKESAWPCGRRGIDWCIAMGPAAIAHGQPAKASAMAAADMNRVKAGAWQRFGSSFGSTRQGFRRVGSAEK